MAKPVRYYIVKTDDQPVVRTVPVAVPATPAPKSAESVSTPRRPEETKEPRRPTDRAGAVGVARLVRAAIGRGGRAH